MSIQEATILKHLSNGQQIDPDLLARLDDGGPVGAGAGAVRHDVKSVTQIKKARAAR